MPIQCSHPLPYIGAPRSVPPAIGYRTKEVRGVTSERAARHADRDGHGDHPARRTCSITAAAIGVRLFIRPVEGRRRGLRAIRNAKGYEQEERR